MSVRLVRPRIGDYRPMIRILLAACLFMTAGLFGADALWTEDFEAAKAKAEKDGKDMLLDFTGSDWCGWCIKLKQEVFDKEAFKTEAAKHFVLVELDYPQGKEQAEKIKKQNEELSKKFGVQGYPAIYLVDSKGRPYAQTGYQEGGPEKYNTHLAELRAKKAVRDELLKKADAAQGLEKAKLLDQALTALEKDGVGGAYEELTSQIIELDKDNEAGLKGKFETRKRMLAIATLAESGDIAGAAAKIEEMLKEPKLSTTAKQEALYMKSLIHHNKNEPDLAIATLKLAKEAAPETERAKEIDNILKELTKGK
jgi:thioredoxin-related protein